MNNKNILQILLLFSGAVFLFIYPWTKEIKNFRAEDINWEILKSVKNTNVFDLNSFSFRNNYTINDEIKKLDGKKIKIKGFFKKEKHNKHFDYMITETVTEVCFMCEHDKHYNLIQLFPEKDELKIFDKLKNDSLIQVSGFFKISKNNNDTAFFSMTDVTLLR